MERFPDSYGQLFQTSLDPLGESSQAESDQAEHSEHTGVGLRIPLFDMSVADAHLLDRFLYLSNRLY